jgi:hypothetical protein
VELHHKRRRYCSKERTVSDATRRYLTREVNGYSIVR